MHIVEKCYVLHEDAMKERLKAWLLVSPLHFYVKHRAPLLKRASAKSLSALSFDDFFCCFDCMSAEKVRSSQFLKWRKHQRKNPLRLFDPFAGAGAFALGMCQVGKMKLTHAIEIDPSAAYTLRYLLMSLLFSSSNMSLEKTVPARSSAMNAQTQCCSMPSRGNGKRMT